MLLFSTLIIPTINVNASNNNFYRNSHVKCYDNTQANYGWPTSCKSRTVWMEAWEEFCKNKCNAEWTKCGINSWWVKNVCIDNINNYYTKVWQGNWYGHHNIYINYNNYLQNFLSIWDEIAVFDWDLIVWTYKHTDNSVEYGSDWWWYILIINSMKEWNLNNGFTNWNHYKIHVYKKSENKEYWVWIYNLLEWTNTFQSNWTSFINFDNLHILNNNDDCDGCDTDGQNDSTVFNSTNEINQVSTNNVNNSNISNRDIRIANNLFKNFEQKIEKLSIEKQIRSLNKLEKAINNFIIKKPNHKLINVIKVLNTLIKDKIDELEIINSLWLDLNI